MSFVFVYLLVLYRPIIAYDDYQPYIKHYTRNITIKQGILQGVVVEPKQNKFLPLVEQYKGIPYAAPPVGELRFMPTRNAPSWTDVKYADSFGPVCPQKFPDVKAMSPKRKEAFLKLKQYLINQSEDCLYLNIYAPYQIFRGSRKYPVMVYIHGESFEWNSGNPYDGSVLAGYGNVIVVTFNFRLGILGFLKAGIEDESKSNFGLVDQIAALVWIRENIEAFGGDSESVTLFGHGTGAVCANLLTISPMVLPANEVLFHRAILMGGSALADWALAGNPRDVTYQVAQALNCPIQEDFETCLRRKRLDEIMNVNIPAIPYRTPFGPVVDSRIVPNDPIKSMTNYTSIFSSFDLMYGVTEMESINLLQSIALVHGMLQKERDQELRKYFRFRCEMKPELCVASTLAEYTSNIFVMDDEGYSTQPEAAYITRDSLLDIFSDARIVAPVVQMGKYHSMVNSASYFYVFKHPTSSKTVLRNKTSTAEDLPYIFGVPIDGPSFHFTDTYTDSERLLSEVIMTYISNFAYTGNPNQPQRNEFYSLTSLDWKQFNIDWPEYEVRQQNYLEFDIPPRIGEFYRKNEMFFWNEAMPKLTDVNRFDPDIPNNFQDIVPNIPILPPFKKPKGTPPWILIHHLGDRINRSTYRPSRKETIFGTLVTPPPRRETLQIGYGTIVTTEKSAGSVAGNVVYGSIVNSPPDWTDTTTLNILIIAGCLIGFINVLVFVTLYYRCYRLKKSREREDDIEENEFSASMVDKTTKLQEREAFLVNGCDLIKIISNSSKSDDTYEAVRTKPDENKTKISRHLSNSTIDAHTKVRDWINNEIISKYSPKNLKKNQKPYADIDLNTTRIPPTILERVPLNQIHQKPRPPLKKQNSLPTHQKGNKVSVAVDATPSGRGPSVLAQQPIELAKSFDHSLCDAHREPPLRRSMTLEDFTSKSKSNVLKNLEKGNIEPIYNTELIKIERTNKLDQKYNTLDQRNQKKLLTFDPNAEINVTSRDEVDNLPILSPEEALLTIKRRNFPKVLPEYPTRAALTEAMANKRRSMPVPIMHPPLSELRLRQRIPPAPPVRTTSTLDRNVNPKDIEKVFTSAPTLNEEEVDDTFSESSSSSGSSTKNEMDSCYNNAKITSVQQADCEERVFVPNFDPCIHHVNQQNEILSSDSSSDESLDENRTFLRPEVVILHKCVSRNNSSGSESSPSAESDTGTILETKKDEVEVLTII